MAEIRDLEKAIQKQQEEIRKMKKRSRKQKWWNIYFVFNK
jgi:hypothetical protein